VKLIKKRYCVVRVYFFLIKEIRRPKSQGPMFIITSFSGEEKTFRRSNSIIRKGRISIIYYSDNTEIRLLLGLKIITWEIP